MVERIAGFLADNALTQSWRNSVGRATNAIERPGMSRDEILQGIGNYLEKGADPAGITDEQLAVLQEVKGNEDIDREKFNALMAQHEGGPAAYLPQALRTYADTGNIRPGDEVLRTIFGNIQGPMNQTTEVGHAVSTLLGHPVMAYSAVTAGGAMGTVAALKAYDSLLAWQEQMRKDSQLPLTGGMQ